MLEKILSLVVLSSTPLGVRDVSTMAGVTHRQAISALHHLHRSGRVKRVGARKPYQYRAPDAPVDWKPLPPPPRDRQAPATWTGPYASL